jgi:hypothetical protein
MKLLIQQYFIFIETNNPATPVDCYECKFLNISRYDNGVPKYMCDNVEQGTPREISEHKIRTGKCPHFIKHWIKL